MLHKEGWKTFALLNPKSEVETTRPRARRRPRPRDF
jgi:hypothetical protein